MANTRAAIFISIALMMLAPLPARTANAQCEACTKLKRANVLGIKRAKEFLIRADQIKVFRSQNKAQSKGYFRYRSCLDPADVSVAARLPCAPVFGIISEKLYLCPAQLKRFRSVDQARRRGYSEHLECLNGIPNPQVTPLPSTYTFTPEAGERFADVDSFSILALAGGGYRNYSGASTSPFLPDTIRHSPSADGITFGALAPITGISPESLETFANPSVLLRQNGTYMMLYEKIRHISSAATEINNLMRAVSADGVSFANSPETSPIPGGSTIASNFDPSLVRVQDATVRLYYSASAKVYSALSTDDGESWTEEGRVPILGRSTSFAPFPIEASVVKDPSGNFLMFFASPLDSETSSYSIFLAKSDDGTNFHVFDEALLIPPEGSSYRDPNAIQLQNGSIRLYFVERTGDLNSQTRATKSGIVQ